MKNLSMHNKTCYKNLLNNAVQARTSRQTMMIDINQKRCSITLLQNRSPITAATTCSKMVSHAVRPSLFTHVDNFATAC